MAINGKQIILTSDGVKKLEDKLEYLKTVKRREVAARIEVALGFGDLSENAEYDEAKTEQAFVEGEILTIENMLRNAQLVDEDDLSTDMVGVGSIVRVMDHDMGEEITYTICGTSEASPREMKVSTESPIGRSLLGKKVGDSVQVPVPDGLIQLDILEISR